MGSYQNVERELWCYSDPCFYSLPSLLVCWDFGYCALTPKAKAARLFSWNVCELSSTRENNGEMQRIKGHSGTWTFATGSNMQWILFIQIQRTRRPISSPSLPANAYEMHIHESASKSKRENYLHWPWAKQSRTKKNVGHDYTRDLQKHRNIFLSYRSAKCISK